MLRQQACNYFSLDLAHETTGSAHGEWHADVPDRRKRLHSLPITVWLVIGAPALQFGTIHIRSIVAKHPPAQIVRDAREHGVEVRPVCVNASRWFTTLEPKEDGTFAVRLGLTVIRGLPNGDAAALISARPNNGYRSVDELWHRAGVPAATLVLLPRAMPSDRN